MKRVSKEELEALRNSGLFDEKWYLEQYPDVKMLGMDPLEHYLWVGAKIGRNPSEQFGTSSYLDLHVDVAAAKVNPLYHYVRWGRKEGRLLNLVGDQTVPSESGREVVLIKQGPYKVKRQYKEFEWKRQERFFNYIEASFKDKSDRYDNILVTVIMPTYNRAKEIGRAIESVCSQSHRCWNLIIADDGSTDNTKDIVSSFKSDKRIDYVNLDHCGVSGARNAGLMSATGRYVAYLDSDNTWDKDFLRSMIVFMEKNDLDAAYSAIRAMNDNGETVCYRGDVFVWSACKSANYIDLNPFVHRRDLALSGENKTLFDNKLRRVVDWDFILRLTVEAKVAYAPFVGVNYYDGESGARITRTEYQNGEMPAIIEMIRAKHAHRHPAHNNLDTGAGMAVSASSADERGETKRWRLRYFPDYTATNSYQKLLYGMIKGYDIGPGSIDECLRMILDRPDSKSESLVFHLHWTNPVFAPAKDEVEAALFVDGFLKKVKLFVGLGGKFVWTIHNVVSHEPKFLEQELRLARGVAQLAHWIHVHAPSVVEATKDYYEIPAEKVLVAGHGNYIGTLPNDVTRDRARTDLGIPSGHIAFLFLGQIRDYKGIDELIDAFSKLSRGRSDCWLVVAGKVLGVTESDLLQKLSILPNVIFKPGYVPDDKMQVYLNSADVMVLPYRKVLTSGSVFLAQSFGLPVICPKVGLLSDVVNDGENGLTYAVDEANGLVNAMQRFLSIGTEVVKQMGANALEAAKSYRWEGAAGKLCRYIEGQEFGQVLKTEFGDRHRTWFVRGNMEHLRRKRCIAVVLHYQNIDDTRNCLNALFEQSSEIGIILISNSELLDDIRTIASEFTDVLAVQSEDNIGYAAANNFGLWICRQYRPEFFWIINPDIVVPVGYYDSLVKHTEKWPDHDFFGTTIVPAHEPGRAIFCGGEVRLDQGARPGHLYMGCRLNELPIDPFECDYLTGANIFGRGRVLDVAGYMPEEYFLYFEETHWFLRLNSTGNSRKPLVFPDIVVKNHKRSEGGHVPSRYYIYYFIRNSLIFGKRFASGQTDISEREARMFADAWLKKIEIRAPDQLGVYETLVGQAFADGKAGRLGRVAI